MSGHDISDGGLVVCLLEMAFAGVCGVQVDVRAVEGDGVRRGDALAVVFSEELGWIIQVASSRQNDVLQRYGRCRVPCLPIGHTLLKGPHSQAIDFHSDDSIGGSPV